MIFHNYIAWANTGIAKVCDSLYRCRLTLLNSFYFRFIRRKVKGRSRNSDVAVYVSLIRLCHSKYMHKTPTSHDKLLIYHNYVPRRCYTFCFFTLKLCHFLSCKSPFYVLCVIFTWCINETQCSYVQERYFWWDLIRWDNNTFRASNISLFRTLLSKSEIVQFY